MSKSEQLSLLFKEWKKAQSLESENDWLLTQAPGALNIKREFFCEDGIIKESVYEKEPQKVLFVSNEANVDDYVNPEDNEIGGRIDSFSEYYESGNDDWGGKMRERICSLFQVIENDYSYPVHENAVRFAFMNLNKRGGLEDVKSGDHIANYVRIYHKFILDEIRIINPDIIIWLGIKTFNMDFKDHYLGIEQSDGRYYLSINGKAVPVIATWHTSHYRISKKVVPMPVFTNKTIGKQATHLEELLKRYNIR